MSKIKFAAIATAAAAASATLGLTSIVANINGMG